MEQNQDEGSDKINNGFNYVANLNFNSFRQRCGHTGVLISP
jgi:hypothetical protein